MMKSILMMPFLRSAPADGDDATESWTSSYCRLQEDEYDYWAAEQDFMEHCLMIDGNIIDDRSDVPLEEQWRALEAIMDRYCYRLCVSN